MSAIGGIAVAAAVLSACGPGGRPVDRLTGPAPGRPVVTADASIGRTSLAARSSVRARRAGRAASAASLAALVTEVAAELRSGTSPAHAWRTALGRPVGTDGVPNLDALIEVAEGAHRSAPRWSLACGDRADARADLERRAVAVVAAGRLAQSLGAPLAPVLDRLADALATDAELDAERRAALAGPRSTATVLAWLPLLGAALGAALGADPLGVMLRGGIGSASGAAGAALLVVGRAWTRRMVSRANRAGRA